MIKITVRLENQFDMVYQEIEISRDELLQIACNKAMEMYEEGSYSTATADDIKIDAEL